MKDIKTKVAIIGGGISGLAFAAYLRKMAPHLSFQLFEAEITPGGFIKEKEGFQIGPHIFERSKSQPLLELIEMAGLSKELLFAHGKKERYLLRERGLEKLPTGLISALFSRYGWTLIKAVFCDLFAKRGEEEESIESFFSRRFGKQFNKTFIDPLVVGIWAGDCKELSIRSCFPRLKNIEEKQRFILPSFLLSKNQPKGLFTLKKGMSHLCETLFADLKESILLNSPITKLEKQGEEFILHSFGKEYKADHVVIATSAGLAAQLLKTAFVEASEKLYQIPHKGIQVVSLKIATSSLPKKGFGYLVPTPFQKEILGCIFDSALFEKGGAYQYFTFMVKEGVKDPLQASLRALKRDLLIDIKKYESVVTHWKEAIPQFTLGHEALLKSIQQDLEGTNLTLLGNYLEGVSVSDCIAFSKKEAKALSSN